MERTHQLLKGPSALTPVCLHQPARSAALALVCLIAVQVLRVMEIEAVRTLTATKQAVVGLYPNRLATTHPPALRMLQALSPSEVIAMHERQSQSVQVNYVVTTLTPLQKQILRLLGVSSRCYTQQRLLARLKIPET